MTKPKAAPKAGPVMGIKGFDANLKCRGFQYEVGKTYTHGGRVEACKGGFHAIPDDIHPLTVFSFYAPAGNRFCRVEMSGVLARENDKIAAEIITVGTEIGLGDLAQEAVNWVVSRATHEGEVAKKVNGLATASGDQGAATASGDQGAATASGYQGAATASGTQGAATASGTRGAATASGDQGAATASGYLGKVMGTNGNALFAVERETRDGPITSVACGIVGQDGIKPDTLYRAANGKLVEA